MAFRATTSPLVDSLFLACIPIMLNYRLPPRFGLLCTERSSFGPDRQPRPSIGTYSTSAAMDKIAE